VASLVSLISPRSRRCGYVVVYGEPGSGKSQVHTQTYIYNG
jgi:KaiC/GvpD/RAD55 family RecA-like ATPase